MSSSSSHHTSRRRLGAAATKGTHDFPTKIRGTFIRSLYLVANHPLEYTRTLIQLGYEPWPPDVGNSLTGKVKYLPSMFQYMKYIKSVDGFSGCWRGLTPRLAGKSIQYLVSSMMKEQLPFVKNKDSSGGGKDDDEHETEILIKTCCWDMTCVTAATIASQPFHVLTVRMMAAFVGRETMYRTLWSSIGEIYKVEGVAGFFRGLIPRLIGETLSVLISAFVVYAIRRSTAGKDSIPNYASGMIGNYTANTATYQFTVVTNCMVVNGEASGLMIGKPPHTPIFGSWTAAWLYFRQERQLRRGASMFHRLYTGNLGDTPATATQFGPIHSR